MFYVLILLLASVLSERRLCRLDFEKESGPGGWGGAGKHAGRLEADRPANLAYLGQNKLRELRYLQIWGKSGNEICDQSSFETSQAARSVLIAHPVSQDACGLC